MTAPAVPGPAKAITVATICSGIDGMALGLDIAGIEHELAWQSEIDPDASAVLARRFPGVPNVGDLRAAAPPPVDLLLGGFPCQPVSMAGKRAGTNDERWLFDDICELLGRMVRPPRWLCFENVRGLLTANDGDAMASVLSGLARLGYVGRYRLHRASDVGAPHRRERVFITAAHADSERGDWRSEGTREAGRRLVAVSGGPVADASSATVGPQPESISGRGRAVVARLGRQAAPDADDIGCEGAEPGPRRHACGGDPASPWGTYEPAIRRWEAIHGPAPEPTVAGRLNPELPGWMMGFPRGWATEVVGKNAALRCYGNAVMPHVVAVAIRDLERAA